MSTIISSILNHDMTEFQVMLTRIAQRLRHKTVGYALPLGSFENMINKIPMIRFYSFFHCFLIYGVNHRHNLFMILFLTLSFLWT